MLPSLTGEVRPALRLGDRRRCARGRGMDRLHRLHAVVGARTRRATGTRAAARRAARAARRARVARRRRSDRIRAVAPVPTFRRAARAAARAGAGDARHRRAARDRAARQRGEPGARESDQRAGAPAYATAREIEQKVQRGEPRHRAGKKSTRRADVRAQPERRRVQPERAHAAVQPARAGSCFARCRPRRRWRRAPS